MFGGQEHGQRERSRLAGARRSRQTRPKDAGTRHWPDAPSTLEKALAALWSDMPVQRCTVHKNRNLLAHAPDRLHEEISADDTDMIYAETKQEKAFIRKWRLKRRAVALIAWRKQETSFSPSRAFLKANGSRSEHRMQSNDCTRSSSGGSRRRPCCLPQKPPPCCSGLC
jgi:Transposase, Mutator family